MDCNHNTWHYLLNNKTLIITSLCKDIFCERYHEKIDLLRRSQAQILSIRCIDKIAWRWSFPTPSFCIVQNINRCRLLFQNLRFWKIATSEKISRATFKKFSRLEIYELLFLWSHVLPIKKFFMTACVLCFKIFCDGLFSLNGFVNSLVSSSSKI